MSYDKFRKSSGLKIKEKCYYEIRKKAFSKNKKNCKRKIYINMTSIPSEKLSVETKKLIKNIIDDVNAFNAMHLEVVEDLANKKLEIRQVGIK